MQVTIKKFKHSLDWYSITDVEIDTDNFHSFMLQYRLGSWYLLHYILKDGKLIHDFVQDFRLDQPWDAVNVLSSRIEGFNCLHNPAGFTKALSFLMDKAKDSMEAIKNEI